MGGLAGGAARLGRTSLADAASALTQEPSLRADVRGLLAHLEFHSGSLDRAYGMLLDAATEVAPHDAHRALELTMLAAALGAFGARWDTVGLARSTSCPRRWGSRRASAASPT